ncbi:hypothetical protein ANCDUO_15273 [Ancylostoma duodenale]|uniref:G-protein coupled receptors family 1 profile domain-containing protein n=1 Tax=Ancylostoma duodenale TaxID=51022 RepID=A0A0C2G0W9_9BILA|nr:hypothetical protein ANCDUO_15273 [Ancylostoma duodenale]
MNDLCCLRGSQNLTAGPAVNLMNETIPYDEEDLCGVEITDHRFYMAVAGTMLSFVSLFCNLLIAKVLCSSRHAHFFFLALLAMSDSFLSFMYGPVIALDIIKDRLQWNKHASNKEAFNGTEGLKRAAPMG